MLGRFEVDEMRRVRRNRGGGWGSKGATKGGTERFRVGRYSVRLQLF